MTATLTRRAPSRVSVAADSDLWVEADGRGGYCALRRDGSPPAAAGEGAYVAALGAERSLHLLVATLGERLDALPLGAASAAADADVLTQAFCIGPGPLGPDRPVLQREVLLPHGRRALLVRYTLQQSASAVLTLEPRLPFRAAAALTHCNAARDVAATELGGAIWLRPYPALPALRIAADVPLHFRAAPHWERGVRHAHTGATEDHHVPGAFTHTLRAGEPATFEFALAGEASADPGAAFRAERRRRRARTPREALLERIVARDPLGAPFLVPGAQADALALPWIAAAGAPRAACAEALAGAAPSAERRVAAAWLGQALAAPAGEDLLGALDAALKAGGPLAWALAADLAGRLAEQTSEPADLRRLGRLRRAAAARFQAAAPPAELSARAAGLRHAPVPRSAAREAAGWADPERPEWPARPEDLPGAVGAALAAGPPTRARLAVLAAALARHALPALTSPDPRAAAAWLAADALLEEVPR